MKRRTSIPQAELETDNALLRKQYLAQHETYAGREIKEASGLKPGNPSEPVSRWKSQGKIFGVPAGRADRFPLELSFPRAVCVGRIPYLYTLSVQISYLP